MDTVLWSLGSGQLVLLRKKKNMWAGITDVTFELVQEEKHAFPQHRSWREQPVGEGRAEG